MLIVEIRKPGIGCIRVSVNERTDARRRLAVGIVRMAAGRVKGDLEVTTRVVASRKLPDGVVELARADEAYIREWFEHEERVASEAKRSLARSAKLSADRRSTTKGGGGHVET